MELKLLQLNGIFWKFRLIGEQALLLEPQDQENLLSAIHDLANQVEARQIPGVLDVVPAYQSLAIIFDERIKGHVEFIRLISEGKKETVTKNPSAIYEIPVCYEMGLDWDEVSEFLKRSKHEIIKEYTSQSYIVAMMGFIPGFVFMDGLSEQLSIPRKNSPRTNIPAGSVGIGGNQTGIYSLESPGGWNIIGRTPLSFFDVNMNPPTKLKSGDKIRFLPITESQFEDWGLES